MNVDHGDLFMEDRMSKLHIFPWDFPPDCSFMFLFIIAFFFNAKFLFFLSAAHKACAESLDVMDKIINKANKEN